jgi:heat shock protein HslJ
VGKSRKGGLSLLDLQGKERVLVNAGRDESLPDARNVTLAFTDEGIAGHSGCNRYFGTATPGEQPGVVSFGPLAGTRMACPQPVMDFETYYLRMLAGVTRYGFLDGQFALTTGQGDSIAVLLFAPRELQVNIQVSV